MVSREDSVLWIGGVELYMSEDFLRNAFSLMGEADSLSSVKLIKNKFTGASSSFGLLQFDSDASALVAMHRLNGKIIPNSQPPVRFQLSHASAKQSGSNNREYSVWVSDLPGDIAEDELKRTFATRYGSLRTCKLIKERDEKVYGFLRFSDMNDQRESLIHMDGFGGLGERPIRVSMAVPKPCILAKRSTTVAYSEMYENYESDGAAWGNYGQCLVGGSQPPVVAREASKARVVGANPVDCWEALVLDDGDLDEGDEDRLVEHSAPVNVDAMNAEFIERSQEVWDAVESDRWIYCLDSGEGIVPNFKKGPPRKRKAAANQADN